MFYLVLLVFLLVVAGLGLLTWQNLSTPVQLEVFNWHTPHLPIGLWLIGFFCLGALLLYIISAVSAVVERRELRTLRKRVEQLEQEKARAQGPASGSLPPGPPSGPLMPPAPRRPTGPLPPNSPFMPMPGFPGQTQSPGTGPLSTEKFRQ